MGRPCHSCHKNPKLVTDMQGNLLRNFHLLFSGHPRSLEFFQRHLLMEENDWSADMKALDRGESDTKLVVESFVLSSLSFDVKDVFFRDTLEKGEIFIVRQENEFFTHAVPVWALFGVYCSDDVFLKTFPTAIAQ